MQYQYNSNCILDIKDGQFNKLSLALLYVIDLKNSVFQVCHKRMVQKVDKSFIPDLPKGGPLAEFRKRATFDWKDLKLIFEEELTLKTKVQHIFCLTFLTNY